ncbi:MAG: leucine-rich repeat protein [Oscillospiraceae bacterium]|nr:leucine-rich repeat protein [Oscillospiraceae bacterium]
MDFEMEKDTLVRYTGTDSRVVLPPGVWRVRADAFSGCKSPVSIVILPALKKITPWTFCRCPEIARYEVHPDHPNYESIDGVVYDKKDAQLVAYPPGSTRTEYLVPHGVRMIGEDAFRCCRLERIILPNSVESILQGAFSGCAALREIVLPDSITCISPDAFAGCTALCEITIPHGLRTVRQDTFSGCSALMRVTFPDTLREIHWNAFAGCVSLTEVTLPHSIRILHSRTFAGCRSLKRVKLPEELQRICPLAFSGCIELTGIDLPEHLQSIECAAFLDCSVLTDVHIPAGCECKDAFVGTKAGTAADPEGEAAAFYREMLQCTKIGRVVYAIMCTERFLLAMYPARDFRPLARKMWALVDGSGYLDEGAYALIEVVPECLLEPENYSAGDFEHLTESEYMQFCALMQGLRDEVNILLNQVYDIAMAYCYTREEPELADTLPPLRRVRDVLMTNRIPMPDLAALASFREQGNNSGRKLFDCKYLSVLL